MDARVRDLERRWRESGDVTAGRAYVRALTRSGAPEASVLRVRLEIRELDPRKLELAAFLGHAPAVEALEGKDRVLLTRKRVSGVLGEAWRRPGRPVVRVEGRDRFRLTDVVSWAIDNHHASPGAWFNGSVFWEPEAAEPGFLALVRATIEKLRQLEPSSDATLDAIDAWCNQPSQQLKSLAEGLAPRDMGSNARRLARILPPTPSVATLPADGPPRSLAAIWIELLRYSRASQEIRALLRDTLVPQFLAQQELDDASLGTMPVEARLADELPTDWWETRDSAEGLRARLERGELPRERLELAAYLGDPAAREVLDEAPTASTVIDVWAKGLAEFGIEPCVRAGLAIVRKALPVWRTRFSDTQSGDAVVLGLERWLTQPGPPARDALVEARTRVREDLTIGKRKIDSRARWPGVGDALCSAVLIPLDSVPGTSPREYVASTSVEKAASSLTVTARSATGQGMSRSKGAIKQKELFAIVLRELLPWVLAP